MWWKQFTKMKREYQFLVIAAVFLILIGIFWPRPTNFSAGISAHLGNLRGSFNIEAFDDKSTDKTFVLFHVPWCGYCKRFKPVWDDFYKKNADKTDVKITNIDCEEYKDFAKQAGISSFPTIKYFPKGLANLDVYQVFKRAGDNGSKDMAALTDFLNDVKGVPDPRANQAGNVDGSGPPVDLSGAPVQTPDAYLANHFNLA